MYKRVTFRHQQPCYILISWGFTVGEGLFLSAVKYCILKYSKKKRCKTNSFNVAVSSHSQMAALVLRDMENTPHVLVLIHKIFPGPTAVVPDT